MQVTSKGRRIVEKWESSKMDQVKDANNEGFRFSVLKNLANNINDASIELQADQDK